MMRVFYLISAPLLIALAHGGFGCGRAVRAPSGAEPSALHADAVAGPSARTLRELRAPADANGGPEPIALQTYFHIWRFQLPHDRISSSDRLWRNVDELAVALDTAMGVKRNGFRVGVADAASWPALLEVLQRQGARAWNHTTLVDHGAALSIELDACPQPQPIFYYDDDGTLCGGKYHPGRRCVRIDHLIDLQRPSGVTFRVVPELRRAKRRYTWDLARAGELPTDEVDTFEELAISVRLEPGEMLLLGPSRAAGVDHLIGTVFLEHQEAGNTYENLICIAPKIFRKEHAGELPAVP